MDPLDAARAVLPWWAVWGPLLFTVPGAFVLTFALTRLALAWPLWVWSRKEALPWPDRARWAYPLGAVIGFAPLLLTALATGWAWMLLSPLTPVPSPLLVGLVGLMALLGSSLAGHLAARRLLPGRVRFGDWPRSLLAAAAMHAGLVVLGAVAACMPARMDAAAWALLAAGAAGFLFFAVGGGVLALGLAGVIRPASERLRRVVAEAAARRGVPAPPVSTLDLPGVNAFALVFLGRLEFTREIEDALTDEELGAITDHELAHLAEPRVVLLGRLLPALSALPLMAWWPLYKAFDVVGVLAMFVPLAAAPWLADLLSRWAERRADAAALGHEAESGVYARALEKLYEANVAPAVAPGRGGTHPHLHDRLIAAGLVPAYERPRPPSRWRAALPLALLAVVAALSPFALALDPAPDGVGTWRMALLGPGEWDLAPLAAAAWDRQDFATAAALHRAEAICAPRAVRPAANAAIALSRLRRCEEAEAMADEAERRCGKQGGTPGELNLVGQARDAVRWCRANPP